MSESQYVSGRRVMLVFAAVVAVTFAAFVFAWWKGPKGRFTEATLAQPLEAPALIRAFCIDPQLPGPKELDVRPRCANADRLEFTMSPVPGQAPHAAWVLVGPSAVGVVAHGPIGGGWNAPIPLKGLPPGAYGLVFVLSDRPVTAPDLERAVSVEGGNLRRLEALEAWANAQKAAGAGVHLVRYPFALEAPRG